MPRVYKRKTTQQGWDSAAMGQAIRAVRIDKMPFATAAQTFDVPRNTLKRRVLGRNKDAVESKQVLGNYRPVFNQDQENELVEHLLALEQSFYGVSVNDLRRLAFQLAERNNLPHRFDKNKEMAGYDWVAGFRKRNPTLTLRKPQSTSLARAQGFNKPNVDKFFSLLKEVQDKHFYPSHRVFNVDETGLTTVQSKNTKVFALKGRRQVGGITSAERGLLSTFVVCMSAGGTYIPPFIIFPRQRMKPELMDGAPPGTAFACYPTGWMQTHIFTEWFNHFFKYAKPTHDDPVLLVLDGHATHVKNIDFIDRARQNHTTVVCLPPHCSHRLQPLDVSFMGPLNTFYVQSIEKYLRNNPGRVVSQFQVSRLMGEAFLRAAVPSTAINGFRKCGIVPLDPSVFSEVDFVAAEVTDIPMNSEVEGLVAHNIESEIIQDHTANTNNIVEEEEGDVNIENNGDENTFNSHPKQTSNTVANDSLPSTSFAVSPSTVVPLPKYRPTVAKRNTNRKRGKTAIVTSSPFKAQLMKEKTEKLQEEERKRKRKAIKTLQERKKSLKGPKKSKPRRKLFEGTYESGEDSDAECFYCNESYSKSVNEGWIRCSGCYKWAHEACTGCEEDDDDFICEHCK